MQVILLERIENLGQMGEIVKVKPGFARNFLLPQKKGLRATEGNISLFESRRQQLEAENLAKRGEAEQVADKMDGLSVVLIRQAGESAQLYGSVSARDLAESIGEAGFTVAKGQIVLDRPIKMLGLHEVRVRLHAEVDVTVTANVARSQDEATMQAETGMAVTAEALEAAEIAAERAAEEALAAADAAEAEAEEAEAADAGSDDETQPTG